MTDIRQSQKFAQYLSEIGWQVERTDGVNYFYKKIFGFFTIVKIQRPNNLDLKKISNYLKTKKPIQVILEPLNTSQFSKAIKYGFKKLRSPYLPSSTLILNLSYSPKLLLTKFKKDARRAINKNRNLQTLTYEIENIGKFRKIWLSNVPPKRFVPLLNQLCALKKNFGDDALFLTTQSHTSGAIFIASGKTAYYWQAFTGKEGRDKQHQYKMVWEGILWAKRKGIKILDFEGIYDHRFPNKSWLGFTHFKKSFAGQEKQYPQSLYFLKLF